MYGDPFREGDPQQGPLLKRVEKVRSPWLAPAPLIGLHEDGRIKMVTEEYGELEFQFDADCITAEFDGNIGSDVQFSIQIELDSSNLPRGVKEVFDVECRANDLVRCRGRLEDLRRLENGWHDGDGVSIEAGAFGAAASLLAKRPQLASAYRIYPTLTGGILFEFENHGRAFSVEFTPEGAPEFFGVQIDDPDEITPEAFAALDERFFTAFDTYVSRQEARWGSP
jgi:hypothetical protein